MLMKIVLGLLVFATLSQFGYTCPCSPMTVEQKYCKADFVMNVRVRSRFKNPTGEDGFDAYFQISRVMLPWKFPSDALVKHRNRVYTASSWPLCGVQLDKNKKYIISGRIDEDRRMRIDLCNSIVERTPVSRSTKKLHVKPPYCRLLFGSGKISY